jgi:hypothetical protein
MKTILVDAEKLKKADLDVLDVLFLVKSIRVVTFPPLGSIIVQLF